MTMMRRTARAYSTPSVDDWAHTRGTEVSFLNYLEALLCPSSPSLPLKEHKGRERRGRSNELTDHTQQTPVRPEEIRDERGREERTRERHWRGR